MAQTIRRAAPTRSVGLQFVALAAVWGCSFLFIKIGLEGLSPGQVVLGRLASGAIALLAVSGLTRQRPPRDLSVWAHLAVVAVLTCVAPFLLFAWAEEHVTSAIASILNATTPLMTMLVAIAALPEERPTRIRLAGLATGFAGVVLVLGPWAAAGHAAQAAGRGEDVLLGELACLLATLCYGLAFVYLRRFLAPRGLAAVAVATGQVGLGALIMVVLAPVVAVQPVHLTPVVGVIAGALVLGERITWNEPVGAAVVVLGVLVTQGRRLPALRRRPAPLASR